MSRNIESELTEFAQRIFDEHGVKIETARFNWRTFVDGHATVEVCQVETCLQAGVRRGLKREFTASLTLSNGGTQALTVTAQSKAEAEKMFLAAYPGSTINWIL